MKPRLNIARSMAAFLAVAVTAVFTVYGQAAPVTDQFFQPVMAPRPVQVMAHRGLMIAAPENTLAAFQLAVDMGFEWIEADVQLTKDGHHVIFHGSTLDGKTNGTGSLGDHTLGEIKALDAGSWFAPRFAGEKVLTLAELLAFANEKTNIYLDCKDVNPEVLVREIRDAHMERQVVVFGDQRLLKEVRELSGGTVPLMPDFDDNPDLDFWVHKFSPAAIEFEFNRLTPELVREAHSAGVLVQCKSLGDRDNPADWQKAIEMGVDWIQTDRGEEIVAAQIMRMLPSPRPVMIVAHRGVSQLAPENTLPAFRKAIALGLDYMEADVWMSKDNRMVVIHDFRVDGKTNGTGIVRNRTFAELRALDAGSKFGKPYAGEKIPTLEEVLELARGKIKLYLDAKYIDPARLVDALRTHRMENDTVVYGGPSVLKELTARAPELKVMPRLEKPDYLDKLAAEVHPYAFDVRWDILSPELIDRCHSLGIKVFSDAIGNHESVSEYRKAVSWGIDAIQTDHPLRLLNAVTRTQQPEMRVERRLTELLRRAGAIASGVRCFATLSMTGARFLDSAGAGTL